MKTALVTGGCSGIGLGLVQHLLSTPEWRVVIADIRPDAYSAISSALTPERQIFVETDVSSWDSQAALFKKAFEWSGGRIDFFAANAGTVERDHLTDPGKDNLDADPIKPDMRCTEVNQIGVFYGLKLFVHYSRVTTRALKGREAVKASSTEERASADPITPPLPSSSSSPGFSFNPKMVITSSCSALYPFPIAVQYAATKAAVLSLTRSVGPFLLATDNIAVNCIMPAYVDTGLTPSEVTALWPKEWITPVATMVRAYEELIAEDGHVEQDGKSDGEDGQVKAGQAVECVVDRLFYRKVPEYADESQRWLIEQSFTPDGVWVRGMVENSRNKDKQEESRDGRVR